MYHQQCLFNQPTYKVYRKNDTNFPYVTDLKKVDQTTIKNKDDSNNLPTNFSEINDTNLPNVIDLKKVD